MTIRTFLEVTMFTWTIPKFFNNNKNNNVFAFTLSDVSKIFINNEITLYIDEIRKISNQISYSRWHFKLIIFSKPTILIKHFNDSIYFVSVSRHIKVAHCFFS